MPESQYFIDEIREDLEKCTARIIRRISDNFGAVQIVKISLSGQQILNIIEKEMKKIEI